MSGRSLFANILGAVMAAAFMQQAAAWGTGGAVTSPFKSLANGNTLFCDLTDAGSTATIDAVACDAVEGCGSEDFVFEGLMVCAEIGPDDPDSLMSAKDVDGDGVPDIGLFFLTQTVMEAGLAYTGDPAGVNGTWSFTVQQGPRDENLLWELTPAPGNATALKFCDEAPPNCVAKFGLAEKENANDYDEQVVDGITLVQDGEVFNFSTVAGLPQNLNWFPCHNGAFDSAAKISCEVNQGGGNKPKTRSEGLVKAIVVVQFEFSPTLNMGNTSETSSMKLTICGSDEIHFAADGAPVDVDAPIRINGTNFSAGISSYTVAQSDSGLCADDLPDLNLQVERSKVIRGIGTCSDGDWDIHIDGLLTNGERFEGDGSIAVSNCPQPQ